MGDYCVYAVLNLNVCLSLCGFCVMFVWLLTLCIAEFLNYKINKFFKLGTIAQIETHTMSMSVCNYDSYLELVAGHKPQLQESADFLSLFVGFGGFFCASSN